MSSIKLYIATTLDGFIAREDGALDWLHDLPNPNHIDYGYRAFFSGIDTVVMGRKTYEEILGFGVEWPYANCTSYVVSTEENYRPRTNDTSVLSRVDEASIKTLKRNSRRGVWIVGGGQVITEFLNNSQVDEMILSIIPTILGKGVRLFPHEPKETKFDLIQAEPFETGVVNLTYRRKK